MSHYYIITLFHIITLLHYYITTLLHYYITTLLHYYITTLLHYYITTLPRYHITTLLRYHIVTLLHCDSPDVPKCLLDMPTPEKRVSKIAFFLLQENERVFIHRVFVFRVSGAFFLNACGKKRVSLTAGRTAFISAAFRVSRFKNN